MNARTVLTVVISAVAGHALADTEIYPTYPGTSMRDYSKPGLQCGTTQSLGLTMNREGDGDTAVYPTYPGTDMRDYSEPGYVIGED